MEGDERREAAIASAAPLQPNFMPKTNNITPSHLSKFHELHKRRLRLKAKSKTIKKTKGVEGNGKSHERDSDVKAGGATTGQGSSVGENSKVQESVAAHHVSTTKHQKKLHWGLDTKERWEMKANM